MHGQERPERMFGPIVILVAKRNVNMGFGMVS